MAISNISKKVAADRAMNVDPVSGLMEFEKDEIKQALSLDRAEKKIEAEAIPESSKKMIEQEIKIDTFTTLRRYVELTPSMCDVRGCGWDAAREMGATDWNNAPVDQVMPGGKTLGQRLIDMKEYHKATGHTHEALNDHIITESELKRRSWAPGQSVALN